MPVGFKPSGACRFACGRGVYEKSAWEGARHEGLCPDQSKASKRPRCRRSGSPEWRACDKRLLAGGRSGRAEPRGDSTRLIFRAIDKVSPGGDSTSCPSGNSRS